MPAGATDQTRTGPAHGEGWPDEASALVARAVEAHGGRARWEAADHVVADLGTASGLLLAAKGRGRTFSLPPRVEVRLHEGATIFHRYPDERHRGRYAAGDVRIETTGGALVRESRDHRRTFRGLAKLRRWDPLDALYFFGYALLHYHVVPFTLQDARFVRVLRNRGEAVGVEVDFPPEVRTHCPRQRWFFGDGGRIVRHDYVAEVIGGWARGCHLWEAPERAGGLVIARRRRVLASLFGRPSPIGVLDVTFRGVSTGPGRAEPS